MSNSFALFELKPRYKIDLSDLNRRYLLLQQQLHPDKHVNSSRYEQKLAEKMSSRCNQAFDQLSNPISRVEHLLNIYSISKLDEVNSELLMKQMDLNEELDSATEAHHLASIATRIDAELADIDRALSRQFDCQDKPDAEAAVLLQKLQFYKRLQSTLMSKGQS